MTETTNLRKLQTGDRVTMVDARDNENRLLFLGFTGWNEQYAETAVFTNWDQVAAATGATTFKRLDEMEAEREYGYNVSAVFYDLEEHYDFVAYRFNGRWVIGSSADTFTLYAD